MVEAYNAKAKLEVITSRPPSPCDPFPKVGLTYAQGAFPDKREAHIGNLIDPSDPSPAAFSEPKFSNFDLAGVGAGFHHFDDPALAARRLAERLLPGGVLFIMDFMPHQVEDKHSHGVMHHGFSEGQLRSVFEGAGVGGEFRFKELEEPLVFHNANGEGQHKSRRVFFARGSKL
jgi:SAM-dependent methyltransferase